MRLTKSATAIRHPLNPDDPLRSSGSNAARTRPPSNSSSSATPRRKGRRGSNSNNNDNQCTMSIAHSTVPERQHEKLPRSIRWRLSLNLLNRPTDCSSDEGDSLLKSVEDLNALKLRFQRSRYDELEKKHYWKSTPMSIADETNNSGGGNIGNDGVDNVAGSAHMEGLHHVAPGDDPLSALLHEKNNHPKNSSSGRNKIDDKKGKLFGGNGIFGNRAQTKSKDSMRTSSFTSVYSSSEGEDEACKGSRWGEFYSTREVLGVIEKDLDRLPADHYTVFHEWRLKDKGWKEHRERDEEWRRRQEEKEDEADRDRNQKDQGFKQVQLQPDEIGVQSQPVGFKESRTQSSSWTLGQSWNMGLVKGRKSMDNLSALLEAGTNVDENKYEQRKQEEKAKAERQASIAERAARLSQILFVYAREHPEVGYRQGMHEILSYVLLVSEMDLLEQAIIMERKNWRRNSLSFGQPNKGVDADGSMAGVDSSGNIVVISLLDSNYILHDAFSLFECIMTSLAPAYDAIPAGDEITASVLEEAKTERGESPMEMVTSSIVSKIRFVARDEQLYGHILYMPVPPQLYFAKWIRLMFGREVAGGMKSVMSLWDAFFDLASARTLSHEEVPITIALLDVLKAAATSMILLIRHNLLSPTMSHDGMMTGEPDPNVGIGYLMNYPPLEDIGPLLETISDLLSKEKKLSNQYLVSKERKLSKQYLPTESYKMKSSDQHPLHMNENENNLHTHPLSSKLNGRANGNYQRNDFSENVHDELPRVYRTGETLPTPHQKHEVVESLGNLAGGLLDFGSKTASAAIASIQKQYEVHVNAVMDHPLQGNAFPSNVRASEPADQSEDYVINYRRYAPKSSKQTTTTGEGDEFPQAGITSNEKSADMVQSPTFCEPTLPLGEESPDEDSVEQMIQSAEKEGSDDDDWIPEKFDSKDIGESLQKSPKELATKLEKSVATLMKHFNDCLSTEADSLLGDSFRLTNNAPNSSVIPDDIWDAMADIDAVRKELLSQAAVTDLAKSSTSLRSSGGSVASRSSPRSGKRRGRLSWQL